ncbi:hypothetical protein LIER_04842 [Lithospermum erythrorhizon]|uniref:RPM1 interacting protein 13 n=1 Tax=Lithospermum erythrorhizon TaxID=34254 RepID=A0AAV3NZ51_LITER
MEEAKSREVVDISSDSESGSGVDFQWIRKLLDDENDEIDDVVVMVDGDDDDDDCVVLDGDPDAKIASDQNPIDDDSDDLLIVSSKGQVACRDFPHPRHLCAKFPFSSCRHEMSCDQCHCYVCDSLAPCVYWGTGVSSFDHCHASDKEAFWKSQRSSLRDVKVSVPIPVPPVHHTAISMTGPPVASQSSPLVPNQVQQNQVLKQFTVRPCSMPTNTLVPNVTRKEPHPGSVLPRSKYQTHFISQPLADTSPLASLTDRRHNNCNLGPQREIFKRTVPAGSALASDRTRLNPSCLSYGPRLPTNPPATPSWQGSHGGMTSGSHAYQSSYLSNVGGIADMLSPQTDPVLGNTMPPQMLSQKSSGNGNDISLQPQFASRQHISSGLTNYRLQTFSHFPVNDVSGNSVPPQQLVSSRTPRDGNFRASFVSGTQTNYQSDMGYGFMNKTPTPHQLTCLTPQRNEGRNIEFLEAARIQSCRQLEVDTESLPFLVTNARNSSVDPFLPYQSPEYNQPSIIPSSHGSMQQGNHTISESLGSNVAVSDFCPVSCTTQSTQLPGYDSLLQNAEQTDRFSANVSVYHPPASLTNFGTTDLEAWLLVDRSVPQSLGTSVPLLNTPIPSPELASLDGGGLFFD